VQMRGWDDECLRQCKPDLPKQVKFCISLKIQNACVFADSDGRFKMKFEGDGRNVGFVAAGIEQEGVQFPRHTLQSIGYDYETCQEVVGHNPVDVEVVETTKMVWSATFDVTDVNFKSDNLMTSLTDGFQTVTEKVEFYLQNVAVVGVASAGKSHLVRGLKAIARNEPVPGVAKVGVSRADTADSENFTEGKITYYEIAGILGKDMQTQMEVHNEFLKKPPKVLIAVFKYGDKDHHGSQEGLKAFFKNVLAKLTKNEVKVVLALTNCTEEKGDEGWDRGYDESAKGVLQQLGLPAETHYFVVNSATSRGCEPRGLQELHNHIMGLMEETPCPTMPSRSFPSGRESSETDMSRRWVALRLPQLLPLPSNGLRLW